MLAADDLHVVELGKTGESVDAAGRQIQPQPQGIGSCGGGLVCLLDIFVAVTQVEPGLAARHERVQSFAGGGMRGE